MIGIVVRQVSEWCDSLFEEHVTFDIDSQPPTRVLGTEPSIEIQHDDADEMLRTSLRESKARTPTIVARPSARKSEEMKARTGSSSQPPPIPRPASSSQPPLLGGLPAPPLSGARTLPGLRRTLHVEPEDVLAEVALAQASMATAAAPKRMGGFVIAMLLLLAAAAAAAVVYFGLPYIYP
jgi:hypothetical protein